MSIDPNLTLTQAVLDEIEALRDRGELGEGIKVEPRCSICCEVESRDLVNKAIGDGLTNRQITENCAGINEARREKGDERIIDARKVWHHRRSHFNVQDPAMAVVREVVERRAKENNRDFLNGVGHAITPYAVLETAMITGFRKRLSNPDSEGPSVKETMDAAVKLHELTSRDAGQREVAEMMATMDRIITAAQHWVPVQDRAKFIAEVEGRVEEPLAVLTERVHDQAEQAVKAFTPPRSMDEGDEI